MRRECVRERGCERHPHAPPTPLKKRDGKQENVLCALGCVTFVWQRASTQLFTGFLKKFRNNDQANDAERKTSDFKSVPCCHTYMYHNRMKEVTSVRDMEHI